MKRRHSRSGGGKGIKGLMQNQLVLVVGVAAIGLAVFGIYKARKNSAAHAQAAYNIPVTYTPYSWGGIGAYHPYAGQLSSLGVGGQQEVGVEPKILKYLSPAQLSSDIYSTLKVFRPTDNVNWGSATTVSAKGAGSRLAMHGDASYQGERNTPFYHGIPVPPSVKVDRVTIASGPSRGNSFSGGVAVGYRPG